MIVSVITAVLSGRVEEADRNQICDDLIFPFSLIFFVFYALSQLNAVAGKILIDPSLADSFGVEPHHFFVDRKIAKLVSQRFNRIHDISENVELLNQFEFGSIVIFVQLSEVFSIHN